MLAGYGKLRRGRSYLNRSFGDLCRRSPLARSPVVCMEGGRRDC